MTRAEALKSYKKELEEKMNSYSFDFANDYYIESDNYLSDLVNEFADNCISVYCYDQKQYYLEHPEECENALLELYDGDSLADIVKNEGLDALICKAGVCGEFNAITGELYEDKKSIIKVMLINHILENEELFKDIEINDLISIVDDSDTEDFDQLSDYEEYLRVNTYEKENASI